MTILINSYLFAADLTPNALDPSYNGTSNIGLDQSSNIVFQINGITAPITLKVTYSQQGVNNYSMYYAVVNIINTENIDAAYSLAGGALANNGTFSVSNGQYVVLGGWDDVGGVTSVGQVLNNSNGDVVLTDITIETN
jgi:hypothetical protein